MLAASSVSVEIYTVTSQPLTRMLIELGWCCAIPFPCSKINLWILTQVLCTIIRRLSSHSLSLVGPSGFLCLFSERFVEAKFFSLRLVVGVLVGSADVLFLPLLCLFCRKVGFGGVVVPCLRVW